MIHRGEIIEQAVRKSGMSITEVARRLNKSRRHLYNLFDESNVSLDVVLQIGEIIHHDFTKEIQVNKKSSDFQSKSNLDESLETEKNIEYWKDKYLRLLEKYNHLLEQQK